MLPASNNGVGMNIGFPDVCPTIVGPAVVPIPYPNMAMNVMAVPFSPNVLLTMMPALNMASTIPLTMGDNPGIPGTTMKPGGYTMGNPTVMINGLPGVNLTCPTYGNMHNDPLGAVLVPSVTNVLFTYADGAESGESARGEALEALGATVASAELTARVIGGAVGYVRFPVIASDAPARFHAALADLAARGVGSVVLDLRGCPGGDLDAALALAEQLLPRGAELATVIDREGDETTHVAHTGSPWQTRVTVLVDGRTASAAEVFAGVLQAHGRARVAGERTYGKGTCQSVVCAWGETSPRVDTVARCLLPGRTPIDGVGISPDLT